MPGEKPVKTVFCVRNQIQKPADEHLTCPYCFGRKRDTIEAGDRQDFCDFKPDEDPVAFGFPEGTARDLKG